jgi:hypothetical protein
MNALLLSLVLTCGSDSNCACAHGKQAAAPAASTATDKTAAAATCDHDHAQTAQAATPAAKSEALVSRGDKLKGLPAVELTKLLASPTDFDGKTVALEGTVRRACQTKGCWMELAPTDKGPGVRITFKDYGFFVPLDSAGSKAKVEGTVKVAVLAPEKAKHYESEGAQVAKAKDGSYREVQLVASGVELRK